MHAFDVLCSLLSHTACGHRILYYEICMHSMFVHMWVCTMKKNKMGACVRNKFSTLLSLLPVLVVMVVVVVVVVAAQGHYVQVAWRMQRLYWELTPHTHTKCIHTHTHTHTLHTQKASQLLGPAACQLGRQRMYGDTWTFTQHMYNAWQVGWTGLRSTSRGV